MDTTLTAPLVNVLVVFGIPVGWLVAGGVTVIGIVNTVKALLPKTLATTWYPFIGLVISVGYSAGTLWPNPGQIIAGSFGLWVLSWGAWVTAKTGAAVIGARGV